MASVMGRLPSNSIFPWPIVAIRLFVREASAPAAGCILRRDPGASGVITTPVQVIVDRSRTPGRDSIVVAAIDGELTVRPFADLDSEDAQVWGVVSGAVRSLP